MTTPVIDSDQLDEQRLRRTVHHRLAREHAPSAFEGLDGPARLRDELVQMVRDAAPLLPLARVAAVVDGLVDEILGHGPLEQLLRDPEITEIMVNGPSGVYVERAGRLERAALEVGVEAIAAVVERILAPLGLRFDRSAPLVDARLPDGSRLHAVAPPIAVDGPYVTIRRFGARTLPVDAFTGDSRLIELLEWAVGAGWNIVVSGGTGSGKTTLLNALSSAVPGHERIVTIEETAELRLSQRHVVRLEARPANAEGVGRVTIRDLVRTALRMRPDRLVIGEVRGPEAFDMVEALNTGHDGSLSTLHANGATEALLRLEGLALQGGPELPLESIRARVSTSLDAVVHVARDATGGRFVETMGEVVGDRGELRIRPLYEQGSSTVAAPARRPRRHDVPPAPGVGQ